MSTVNIIEDNSIIIEPSAGNGAFIPGIQQKYKTSTLICMDIKPEHESIITQDFLTFEPPNGIIHIIGNPPFGRQASLAKKFIQKACEFATSISFILPKSFKKEFYKNAFDINFHLLSEFDIPPDSFLRDDKVVNVPCVFQVWVKRNYQRVRLLKEVSRGYSFVGKLENPHLAVRRVGINAGKFTEIYADKSSQTHYFIRFENGIPPNIHSIEFVHDNTVGPRSVSKQELIRALNNLVIV